VSFEIRPLNSDQDYAACVELQRALWGPSDTVPSSLLKVSQKVGAIAAGAFAPDGTLLGFVFGLTGVRSGELVHWSHMLAVRPEVRDRGIGRQLKLYQRRRVAEEKIGWMYWTFDPLVSRNALFNLERLGVEVEEYVVDMYPILPDSPTDAVVGTDRFIVRWRIAEPPDAPPPERPVRSAEAPVVNLAGDRTAEPEPGQVTICRAGTVRVAVPADIQQLKLDRPELAARWRHSTRQAMLHYLGRGYRVVGFERPGVEDNLGYYFLVRS
jgi:predicted GNAT superfamily acetyltransferase